MELKNYQQMIFSMLLLDASKIDLDFVALQLMEKASSISNGELPEIEARVIRQKINYSVITKNEALVSIKEVLGRVRGMISTMWSQKPLTLASSQPSLPEWRASFLHHFQQTFKIYPMFV